jgi:hypothetical protein
MLFHQEPLAMTRLYLPNQLLSPMPLWMIPTQSSQAHFSRLHLTCDMKPHLYNLVATFTMQKCTLLRRVVLRKCWGVLSMLPMLTSLEFGKIAYNILNSPNDSWGRISRCHQRIWTWIVSFENLVLKSCLQENGVTYAMSMITKRCKANLFVVLLVTYVINI